MSDQLDKFIQRNKSEFDDLEPSEGLWNKISDDLPQSNQGNNTLNIWWKVAAVFLLFTTGWLLYDKFSVVDDQVASIQLPAEFVEAESYYSDLISQKRNQLVSYNIADEELSAEFLMEVDRLDSMYLMLKTEFSNNQSNEQIQNAMIVNLQLRLNILNQQLEILERLKNLENDENISI